MSPSHAIALVGALAALSGAARAEQPCAADAKRFCGAKGAQELLSCLQAHRPDLAPACVQRVEKVVVFFQSAATACKPDAFEFCPGVAPGLPMVDCLRAREAKLTPPCRQFFDLARARDESVRKACADEVTRACPGAAPGRGEISICLGLGAVEVSDTCAAAL